MSGFDFPTREFYSPLLSRPVASCALLPEVSIISPKEASSHILCFALDNARIEQLLQFPMACDEVSRQRKPFVRFVLHGMMLCKIPNPDLPLLIQVLDLFRFAELPQQEQMKFVLN